MSAVPTKLLGPCDVLILHGISMDQATEESHINKCEKMQVNLVSSTLFSTDLVYNGIRPFRRGQPIICRPTAT